jgi:hypothetical protein
MRSLVLALLVAFTLPALAVPTPAAATPGPALVPALAVMLQEPQQVPPAAEEDDEDDAAPDIEPGLATPLFSAKERLAFTLEADFDQLTDDRDDENPERPGIFRMTTADGEEISWEIKVRTRGNFRLKKSTCRFPPIRLNFKKKEVIGTEFEFQDKLKLVTHCQDRGDRWEQQVLREYSAYLIYNQFTDRSFRARLAEVTYIDTHDDEPEPETHFAFLIEDEDHMASRIRGGVEDVPTIHPARYDGGQMALLSIFQYMIGNTDWSAYQFHNTVPIREDGPIYYTVPYDFDWSGLVDAPYAEPDPSLGTRNVRQRVYRGFCWPDVDYEALYATFLEKKDTIYAEIAAIEGISEDNVKDITDYLDDFYETLESERSRKRNIEESCRSW